MALLRQSHSLADVVVALGLRRGRHHGPKVYHVNGKGKLRNLCCPAPEDVLVAGEFLTFIEVDGPMRLFLMTHGLLFLTLQLMRIVVRALLEVPFVRRILTHDSSPVGWMS